MAKLYIIPTPIGNLEDITLRAIRLLKEVDLLLAEDTRTTQFLLKHLGIEKQVISHHKYNEHAKVEAVAQRIEAGLDVGLVSDAGTPGISDPGFLLVRTCVERGIEVETLPGATALIPALVQSGFPCDRFCFEGFLPQKKGGVNFLGSDEAKGFLAVAAIHTAGFEDQVFAVHIRQRKHLWAIIESDQLASAVAVNTAVGTSPVNIHSIMCG